MVTCLRDDAHIGKLPKEIAREARALAVGHQSVEAAQLGRRAERRREDPHLRPLTNAADAGGSLVGVVDVVEDGYAHGYR